MIRVVSFIFFRLQGMYKMVSLKKAGFFDFLAVKYTHAEWPFLECVISYTQFEKQLPWYALEFLADGLAVVLRFGHHVLFLS